MLKFQINRNDANISLEKLDVSTELAKDGENIEISCNKNHNLLLSDVVYFIKDCGDNEFFRVGKNVKNIGDDYKTFSVDNFDDYQIHPTRVLRIKKLFDHPYSAAPKDYLCFIFDDGNQHDFCECRRLEIKESLLQDNYKDILEQANRRRCPDDYFLYNKIFLYKAGKNTNNSEYDLFEVRHKNTTGKIYFDYNGKNQELECIVPVSYYTGQDNRNLLYWKITDEDVAKYIEDNFSIINFYFKDYRFFDEKLKLKKNVSICKEVGNIKINFPFEEHFETNMLQYEHYNEDYAEQEIEKNVSPVVDMEKQIFFPYYREEIEENDEAKKIDSIIKEIVFNFHFRKREDEDKSITGGTIYKIDSAWRNNKIDDDWITSGNRESDLLGFLGFTNDDVYYQKAKLKKSFLRLSFYNDIDRAKQDLLYYSTVFIDGGVQYGKYCKNLNKDFYYFADDAKRQMTLDPDVAKPLTSELRIRDVYNTEACSEGYYLYLFPSNIIDESGATIYMKAEFNHAKYGQTIPMMSKKVDSGYTSADNTDTKGIKEMFKDLYIPILILYDKEKNKYKWIFDKKILGEDRKIEFKDGILTITLYEPIVYKK